METFLIIMFSLYGLMIVGALLDWMGLWPLSPRYRFRKNN